MNLVSPLKEHLNTKVHDGKKKRQCKQLFRMCVGVCEMQETKLF